jgi:hypothetical protein
VVLLAGRRRALTPELVEDGVEAGDHGGVALALRFVRRLECAGQGRRGVEGAAWRVTPIDRFDWSHPRQIDRPLVDKLLRRRANTALKCGSKATFNEGDEGVTSS